MPPTKKDPKRDERITLEIIADANGPEEQAMGWYYYLEDKVHFPFLAQCIADRAISPLRKGLSLESQITSGQPEEAEPYQLV